MIWTPELVQQCFETGFKFEDDGCFYCTGVICHKCPLYEEDTCLTRNSRENPDLLAIIQTHFPEHLL